MDFKLHDVGLIKYEIEEIVRALDLSAQISLSFEQNTTRYDRTKTISNRLKTLIVELEATK